MAEYGFGRVKPKTKTFEARYRTLCAECDQTIFPGDEIGYNADDVVVHQGCRSNAENSAIDITRKPSKTPDDVCPVCSLVHRGECF
jgi:hypothetical protein